MKLEAILFDCDGVLIDSEVLLMASDLKFFKSIGLDYTSEEYHAKFVGSTFQDNLRVIREDMMRTLNQKAPETLADDITSARYQSLRNDLRPIKGALDLVQSLPCKKAVASNTMQVSWLSEKMKITGLYDDFAPHIYAAECVENGKPAPDLYLYAAEKLGVKPENCLVIEDSPRGAAAGIAAGMFTVGFMGASHLPDNHEDRLMAVGVAEVFKDHTDFGQFIARHFDVDLQKAV